MSIGLDRGSRALGEVLGISPAPFLISEALLSNTGGVATLVGDPPNVLIGSAANLSFLDFITHSMPVVFVVWLAALLTLRILFQKDLHFNPQYQQAVKSLNPAEALNDPITAKRIIFVIAGAVVLFFLHGKLHLSPSFVALASASVALVIIRPPVDAVLKNVEWSVLVFFGALFVMVGGLEKSGVLQMIISGLDQIVHIPPVLFGILLIWTVAALSAVVDNVPITIALIPVIKGLESSGVDIAPLWWALAFGAGFGGNGTIIGSSANIIVAMVSERTRDPITSKLWNQRGLPVMIITCTLASIIFALAYPLFTD